MYKVLVFDFSGTIVDDRSGAAGGLLPGVKEFFIRAKEHYKLATNTSLGDSTIESRLETLQLKPYFDLVLGSTSGTKIENMKFIMKYFRVQANEVLMVGDTFQDYYAAKETLADFAGMRYLDGNTNTIVQDFFELRALLEKKKTLT